MKWTILFLWLGLLLTAVAQQTSAHGSRRIDDKVKGMSEATRKRVLAMQQAGVPHKQIAKKIQYEAGSEGTARRMMEKINLDEGKKQWAHSQKQKSSARKAAKATTKKKNKARG